MTSFVVPADFRTASQVRKAKALFDNLNLAVALNKRTAEAMRDANIKLSLGIQPGISTAPTSAEVISDRFARRDRIIADLSAATGRYNVSHEIFEWLKQNGDLHIFTTFWPKFRDEYKSLQGIQANNFKILWNHFKQKPEINAIAFAPEEPGFVKPIQHYAHPPYKPKKPEFFPDLLEFPSEAEEPEDEKEAILRAEKEEKEERLAMLSGARFSSPQRREAKPETFARAYPRKEKGLIPHEYVKQGIVSAPVVERGRLIRMPASPPAETTPEEQPTIVGTTRAPEAVRVLEALAESKVAALPPPPPPLSAESKAQEEVSFEVARVGLQELSKAVKGLQNLSGSDLADAKAWAKVFILQNPYYEEPVSARKFTAHKIDAMDAASLANAIKYIDENTMEQTARIGTTTITSAPSTPISSPAPPAIKSEVIERAINILSANGTLGKSAITQVAQALGKPVEYVEAHLSDVNMKFALAKELNDLFKPSSPKNIEEKEREMLIKDVESGVHVTDVAEGLGKFLSGLSRETINDLIDAPRGKKMIIQQLRQGKPDTEKLEDIWSTMTQASTTPSMIELDKLYGTIPAYSAGEKLFQGNSDYRKGLIELEDHFYKRRNLEGLTPADIRRVHNDFYETFKNPAELRTNTGAHEWYRIDTAIKILEKKQSKLPDQTEFTALGLANTKDKINKIRNRHGIPLI